ncbi:MAG: DUF4214 domain-containing protein [Christensenellaceae bacterium]|jgi:hypothetical protein
MKRGLLVLLALLIVLTPLTLAAAESPGAEELPAAEELPVAEELLPGEGEQAAPPNDAIVEQLTPEVQADAPEAVEPAAEEPALEAQEANDGKNARARAVFAALGRQTAEPLASWGYVYDPNFLKITRPGDFSLVRTGTKVTITLAINGSKGMFYDISIHADDEELTMLEWVAKDVAIHSNGVTVSATWDTAGYGLNKYYIYADVKERAGDYGNDSYFDVIPVTITKQNPTLVEDFVTRLYSIVLMRNPEPAGLSDWANKLSSKQISGADAAYGFFFSDEMKARALPSDIYIEVLYQALMGRGADPGGKTGWLEQIGEGQNREQIFAGFVNSPEFGQLCAAAGIDRGSFTPNPNAKDRYQIEEFVDRLYFYCLFRQADEVGLRSWTDQLMSEKNSGTDVAYGFFFSPEMTGMGLNDWEYVEILYLVMLDRTPDDAGIESWVQVLSGGATREEIFYGFANSIEFGKICSSYGIRR